MTPSERLQKEKELIIAKSGIYITPFRMSNLMRAASRIMDILAKADANVCYEECRLILEIVAASMKCVTKEDKCL